MLHRTAADILRQSTQNAWAVHGPQPALHRVQNQKTTSEDFIGKIVALWCSVYGLVLFVSYFCFTSFREFCLSYFRF